MNDKSTVTIEKGIHIISFPCGEPVDEYERLYIGDDFCERLIPEVSDLERILEYAQHSNKKFTLLTAYYTDKGLEKLKVVLDILNLSGCNIEITVNDFGVLKILNSHFLNLTPIWGRLNTSLLLHPYSRAAGLLNSRNKLHRFFRERFSLVNEYLEFLHECKIKRVEFDNIYSLPLFADSFLKEDIAVSLYYPFTYVTTSRRCLFASRKAVSSRFALLGCKKECLDYKLILQNRNIGQKIFVRGNAQFINNKIKQNITMICKKWGVDRLITFSI